MLRETSPRYVNPGHLLLRYSGLIANVSRARVVLLDDGNFVRSHGFPILFALAIDYTTP